MATFANGMNTLGGKVELSDISLAVYKASLQETKFIHEHFDEWHHNEKSSGYPFFDYLIKRNDKEALEYLLLAKRCEESRFRRYDPWYYPSKEDLEFIDLKQIYKEALAYKGDKLKSRYFLQAMRAAYSMFDYENCLSLWENEILLLPADAITKMSACYIGSIYYNQQEYEKAAIIYSKTNDIVSLKWCISKLEKPLSEVETIEAIYKFAPQYPDFPKMIAPYIRRAEKTTIQKWITHPYWSWYDEKDYSNNRETYQQLIQLALKIVKEQRTHDPAYWQSVASYLTFLDGNYQKANKMLQKAEVMKAEIASQNNIRVLRMLYDAVLCKYNRQYERKLLSQLQWLYQMAEKTPYDEERIYNYRNRYTDVLERLVDYHWLPAFQKQGKMNRVCGLIGLKSEIRSRHFAHRTQKADTTDWFWNHDYSSSVFCHLDTIPLQDVIAYKKYLFGRPKSALDKFVAEKCYRDESYYSELIATKYIRTANFEEAIPYLENISNEFLSRQNIFSYLVDKDETTDIWDYHPSPYSNWINIDRKDFKGKYNNKLHYCKKMIAIKKQIDSCPSLVEKSVLLYEYATRLFHASYQGKLWAITHYGKGSLYGGGENGLLEASKQMDTLSMLAKDYFTKAEVFAVTPGIKAKSIFAQAHVSEDKCFFHEWQDGKWQTKLNWQSKQRELYNKLLFNANQEEYNYFVQRCDLLQDYSLALQNLW